MRSLLPIDKERPKFAQLYIYNIEHEISNRIGAIIPNDNYAKINKEIIEGLIQMFVAENQIVRAFKMARDHFKEADFLPMRLRLLGKRHGDGLEYNAPSVSEIAG